MNWWQTLPYNMKPYLFKIASFELRYYGLMYIIGFAIVYFLSMYRIKKQNLGYSKELVSDFMFYMILGTIIGARLGYVIFYNPMQYLKNPLEIISPFSMQGGFHFTGIAGMSYHGGFIGITLACVLFMRKKDLDFFEFIETFVPAVPLGYMFGRIGNFINGELYGRVTDSPIGMVFPLDTTHQLRHPSQLYEAFGEGLVLFLILWFVKDRIKIKGSLISIYIMGYASARFIIEFFREPDSHLGKVLGFMSMGQVLSSLMFLAGLAFFIYRWNVTKKSE